MEQVQLPHTRIFSKKIRPIGNPHRDSKSGFETRSSSIIKCLAVLKPYSFKSREKLTQSKLDTDAFVQAKSIESLNDDIEVQSPTTTEFHPWLWTSLALFCGFLLAVATEIRIITSHYHFNARFLQAPGTFITNIMMFGYFSFCAKTNTDESNLIDEDNQTIHNENRSYFSWISDIFYVNTSIDSSTEDPPVQRKTINKSKIFAFLAQIILNIITFWLQIESLYFAKLCNVNAGVIMSLFSMKPILSFLLFYFTFGYTISRIETYGMIIAIISVIIISFSKVSLIDLEDHITHDERESFILSALCMLPCVLFICIRNLIFKVFFKSNGAFDEIFVVQILVNFTVSTLMLIWGTVIFIQGFRFELTDMFIGMTGGILNLICSIISIMVVVKGRAGPADALVETSSLFLVLIESGLFLRLPNTLQWIGICLAFVSTLLIIKGSHS